jgi:hypothetical protein
MVAIAMPKAKLGRGCRLTSETLSSFAKLPLCFLSFSFAFAFGRRDSNAKFILKLSLL